MAPFISDWTSACMAVPASVSRSGRWAPAALLTRGDFSSSLQRSWASQRYSQPVTPDWGKGMAWCRKVLGAPHFSDTVDWMRNQRPREGSAARFGTWRNRRQARQDKNPGVDSQLRTLPSLSTDDTRGRLCVFHVGIGPHYCVLAKGSQDSTRLSDRPAGSLALTTEH